MAAILEYIDNTLLIFKSIRISDVFDILIVAFLIYKLIGLVRKTNSIKFARAIILILVVLWLSGALNLYVVNFLTRTAVEIGLLALVILFQPELRRMLERVGHSSISSLFGRDFDTLTVENTITQTVLACTEMSRSRTGALIVFERITTLDDQMNTGTIIDADVTAELYKNIFFNKAPLHDGAVIIRNGRIASAGCMLPLSSNTNLSRDLGMRHRAGIGMSENSDAVVAIVSEESGAISIAVDGMLKRHLTSETFEKLLRNELIGDDDAIRGGNWFTNLFKVKNNGKKDDK